MAPFLEKAVQFHGLNTKVFTTQPPIKDKNGKDYDLNDPEFPVVKDHKFRLNYWAMPRSPAFMLRYTEEHWEYFNRTRFNGKLTKPTFRLLKDMDAMRMKLRGRWWPGDRILELSPNLFNAPHEGWVNRIMIHEMCHEYVSEIHGLQASALDGKKTKGHGSLWQQAMRMAGLPPSRFDSERNEMYMDKFELKKHKPVLDMRARMRELQGTRMLNVYPRQFDWVIIPDHGGITRIVMLACGSTKKAGHWVAVEEDGRWWRLPPSWLFQPNDSDLTFVKNMQSKFVSHAYAIADRALVEGI